MYIGVDRLQPLTELKTLNWSTPKWAQLISSSRTPSAPNLIKIGEAVASPPFV
jgi:hypothetical protein